MADEITRNLLLKQDIDFDTAGTGATVERDNPAGGTVTGHKVNASHIPTTAVLRALMGETSTVEDTLKWLYENFSSVGGDAATNQKGIIEIATLIEAKAGTDTVKAITPYLFKNTKASTTQFGTLLLASSAEALAGTDTEKAIVPATLKDALDAEASNIEHGMILSNNATDALNDIDVSTGKIWDSTYTYAMSLFSVFTKRIDAIFATGTGNGGFPSALTLAINTWYHVFAIYNPTTGETDIGFDISSTATNLLADATGYTVYRHLGWVKTDGSLNIIPMSYTEIAGGGIRGVWKDNIADISATPSLTAVLDTISAPPDSIADINVFYEDSSATANMFLLITETSQNDSVPSVTNFTLREDDSANSVASTAMQIKVDSSSQIRQRSNYALGTYKIWTKGFTDQRR